MAISDHKIKTNLVVTGGSIKKGSLEVSTQAGTETLTNKTIDASSNTLSNIPNSSLSSGIDASKIADGSVSNAEFQYLSNVTSDIQTQFSNKVSTSLLGANSGVATLDANGKLSNSQIPAIAITDTFVVASQVAMLALSVQTGDVAVRTDLNKSFILAGTDPTVLGDWQELLSPTDAVTSVNGQTGTVVLDSDDISEGTTNLYFSNERAQDAVGAMVANSSKVSLTYVDGTPSLTADIVSASLVNADISASAAIDASKIADGSVSSTEFQYLSGVTSDIQTQFSGKQAADATLTALAAFNSNGIIVQTAADTFTSRSIAAGSSKISISDGSGVAGNPTIDVSESNLTLDNIGGTLSISKGGTGQTSATAAFDALAPSTTKGDIIVHNGTDNIRLAAGTNGYALVADSSQASGLKYAAVPVTSANDINETSFSMAESASSASVTGFAFASARSFKALVSVMIDATADIAEVFELMGVFNGTTWNMSVSSTGDDSLVSFAINNSGQVQYSSSTYAGFVSGTMKFRAISTTV